jgi:hypothetical protein
LIIVYSILVILALSGFGRKKAENKGLTPQPVEKEDKSVRGERERLKNDDWRDQNGDIVRALDVVKQYDNPDPNPQ